MKKRMLYIFVAVMALASLGSQAQAEAKKGVTNSHARISPTLIWIDKPGGIIRPTRAVFPILTVPETEFSEGRLAKVCQNEARVREAIIAYFQRNPAPLLRNGHVDVKALDKIKRKLAALVNGVLKKRAGIQKPLISEIAILVQDPDKGTKKGVMSRFPSARGCNRVANEFIELMKNRVLGGGTDAASGVGASGNGGGGN